MTTIGLIRHGQTDWNKAGKMQGHTDIPLNDQGKIQARQLAEHLSRQNLKWDAIYSSDLQRASMTANIISGVLHLGDVRVDERLRERSYGKAEGMTVAERKERFGDRLETEAGIETEAAVIERGRQFLEQLMAREEGKRILLVSHGGFLKRFIHMLIDHLPDVYIDNASLTIVENVDGQWKVRLHNFKVQD